MPRLRAFLLSPAILLPAVFLSAAPLKDAPEYTAARQALADGLPSVAAVKAERLLKDRKQTRAEARHLATFATEAWARARDGAHMLALADAHELDDETFWRAQALALNGDLNGARRLITDDDTAPRQPRTRLLLAQILTAQGENTSARAELAAMAGTADSNLKAQAALLQKEIDLDEGKPLPTAEEGTTASDLYFKARSQLQAGQIPAAQTTLATLRAMKSGGERAHHAAALLEAEILLRRKQPEAAQEHLLKFLDTTVDSAVWDKAFDILDRSHQAIPSSQSLPEAVLRWISSGNTSQQQPEPPAALVEATAEFRGHAIYITARWLSVLKRDDEAVSLLEALLQLYPKHPRLNEAMRLAMEIYVRQGADDRVLIIAENWRQKFGGSSAEVDFPAAGILFRRGEPSRALELFQNAANAATTLTERRRALFNAGLAAVLAGDFTFYQSLLGQLEVVGNAASIGKQSAESAATLELEKALFLAANHKQEAESALRSFIRSQPRHPRFADACVALTELLLMSSPPRIDEAKLTLASAATADALTAVQRQRIDYTRLWLLDASNDLNALVTEGASFVKAWPQSNLTPEVRLRIAGAHYRLEDFANARTEFEIIAREEPDTPQAETALYFAAMSAASVMSPEGRKRARVIWDELAQKGGALGIASRHQQALSERLQGDLPQSLASLDKLLAIKTLDAEQRRTTVCEKAEVLFLLGKTEPARLDAAVELLDGFLSDHSLPLMWKARAGFTLATVHHDAKRDTEALEACYNVLRAAEMTPPASPADYVWLAKAGFFGIDLLEASHQWEAAAHLAEQIARHPGDRALEARERATKIRLEHFLWDGPTPTPPKVMPFENQPAEKPVGLEKPTARGSKKTSR